jgi:hypothetical protein
MLRLPCCGNARAFLIMLSLVGGLSILSPALSWSLAVVPKGANATTTHHPNTTSHSSDQVISRVSTQPLEDLQKSSDYHPHADPSFPPRDRRPETASGGTDVKLLYQLEQLDQQLSNLTERFNMTPRHIPLDLAIDSDTLQKEAALLIAAYGPGEENPQSGIAGVADSVPWYSLMLQSCNGGPEDNPKDNGDNASCAYLPTKVLQDPRASYIRSLLEPLRNLLVRARLSIMLPGCIGYYHRDPGKFEHIARIHIPVSRPSDDYVFLHGGLPVVYDVGAAVMGDFSIPHTLWNFGNATRTTLLLDIVHTKPALLTGPIGEALRRRQNDYKMTRERERLHRQSSTLLRNWAKLAATERKAVELRRAKQYLGLLGTSTLSREGEGS